MAATTAVTSNEPAAPPRIRLWKRILAWTVRLVLLLLIVKLARNPWPLLRSRIFPALLLWIIFLVYWGIAGRNSAPARTSEPPSLYVVSSDRAHPGARSALLAGAGFERLVSTAAPSLSRGRRRDRASRIHPAGSVGPAASRTQLEWRSQNQRGSPVSP